MGFAVDRRTAYAIADQNGPNTDRLVANQFTSRIADNRLIGNPIRGSVTNAQAADRRCDGGATTRDNDPKYGVVIGLISGCDGQRGGINTGYTGTIGEVVPGGTRQALPLEGLRIGGTNSNANRGVAGNGQGGYGLSRYRGGSLNAHRSSNKLGIRNHIGIEIGVFAIAGGGQVPTHRGRRRRGRSPGNTEFNAEKQTGQVHRIEVKPSHSKLTTQAGKIPAIGQKSGRIDGRMHIAHHAQALQLGAIVGDGHGNGGYAVQLIHRNRNGHGIPGATGNRTDVGNNGCDHSEGRGIRKEGRTAGTVHLDPVNSVIQSGGYSRQLQSSRCGASNSGTVA